MRVADVYQSAKSYLGQCDQTTIFGFLTDSLQVLSNKGQFDVLKAYIDLPVQANNLVTLPEFVETPLKITIGGNTSFSRDRSYEFSINGPGPTAKRTSYGWEDRGFVPTLITLPSASRLLIAASSPDAAKEIVIQGRDANNNEIKETLVIGVADVATTQTFSLITEIGKDVTTNAISLFATADGIAYTTLLSAYQPYETNPNYRQIRLSDTGFTVRMLIRRKIFKIYTMDDFIPVQSTIGLMLMIKALLAYGRNELQQAEEYEKRAVAITNEAQQATTSFMDMAKDSEKDSARGYNLNNRDSVIMSDVYDEVAEILGPVGPKDIYDATTEALEALNNRGHWDGLVGYVDIVTDVTQRNLTLPRYVESPIEINFAGRPTFMRNKWFEFHLNGPGSTCNTACNAWDWVGDACTQNPLSYDVQLVAIPDDNDDDNLTITIYGDDENGKWIRTNGQDGYVLPINHTKTLPLAGDQKFSRIERVTRDETAGFVRMVGYSTDQTQSVQLGYYYPDETEPQYMRIRIPTMVPWVRMRYRKRTLKITGPGDPLHVKSGLAITTMVRSIFYMKKGDEASLTTAGALDAKAVDLITQEQGSRNPGETFQVQFGPASGFSSGVLVI